MAENTCGNCRHWHKQDLMPQGECRESPPHIIPQLRQTRLDPTPQISGQVAFYPVLHQQFRACDRFKAKLALVGGNGDTSTAV